MEPTSIRNSQHRAVVAGVRQAALAAVEPGAAVRRHLRREGSRLIVAGQSYDLTAIDRVWIVGGGKAAPGMAAAAAEVLSGWLSGGVIVTKYGHAGDRTAVPVEIVEAGHPVPDAAGLAGAQAIARLLAGGSERDLVVAVLSGGASALLPLPAPGLALDDVQATTDLLLRSGATIVELNAVRKHLSQLQGGGLARMAAPARVVALVLSDVVGDPLDVVASGPTAADPTTFDDAWAVLERFDLSGRVPAPIRERLAAGRRGELADTQKPGDPLFERVQNVIVASNRLAAEAATAAARAGGLNALLLSTYVEGEARQVARVAAALVKEMVYWDRPLARPACLVWGGETTVTVHGTGRGGRNQELSLAAAMALDGVPDVLLIALGTDGTDGPTDAAGAVATGETMDRARALGLDAAGCLARNDAYSFFDALDDLLLTGPTGTNVNDLLFLFAFPPGPADI